MQYYWNHHHHVTPSARISLTLSRHPSLSSIVSSRSSRATSHIYTELLYVGSSWSSYLCLSIWRGPQEYVTICLCIPPDRTWYRVNEPKVDYSGDLKEGTTLVINPLSPQSSWNGASPPDTKIYLHNYFKQLNISLSQTDLFDL